MPFVTFYCNGGCATTDPFFFIPYSVLLVSSQIDDALMLQFDSLIHLNLQNNSITEIKIPVGKLLSYLLFLYKT